MKAEPKSVIIRFMVPKWYMMSMMNLTAFSTEFVDGNEEAFKPTWCLGKGPTKSRLQHANGQESGDELNLVHRRVLVVGEILVGLAVSD